MMSYQQPPLPVESTAVNHDNGTGIEHQPRPAGNGPPSHSMTNLFINGLPLDAEENQLTALFEPFGEIISAAVMRNIHTGESLGNGFVRYVYPQSAVDALAAMSGHKIGSHTLSIQWAKKQHDSAPIGEARRFIKKIFVRNVPLDVSETDLATLFGPFGPLRKITVHKDTVKVKDKSLIRRIAFVIYSEEGSAAGAVDEIHNKTPFESCNGVPLMVKLADDHQQQHPNSNRMQGGNRRNPSYTNSPSHGAPSHNAPPHNALSHNAPPPNYYEAAAPVITPPAVPPVQFPVVSQPHPQNAYAPHTLTPNNLSSMGAAHPLSEGSFSAMQHNSSHGSPLSAHDGANHTNSPSTPTSASSFRPQPPAPAGTLSPMHAQLSFYPDEAASTPGIGSRPLSRASSQGASAASGYRSRLRVSISLSSHLIDKEVNGAGGRNHRNSTGLLSCSSSERSFAATPTSVSGNEGVFREVQVPPSVHRSNCNTPPLARSPMSGEVCHTGGGGRVSPGLLEYFDDAPIELNLSRTHTPRRSSDMTPNSRYRHNPYDSASSRVVCTTPNSSTTL